MIESQREFVIFDIACSLERITLSIVSRYESINITILSNDDDVHSVTNLNIIVGLLLLTLVQKLVCKMDFIRGVSGRAIRGNRDR